eukprot:CAMPEP_0170174532 /NCGR_PEP_ID=MMETSP0040_2-20121228/7764_1 /TAXON_ID=641309 /ORGANISM="Lotharella oceanica, Strain CCMP622" /LENGTH=77 /DNA_ID=CAMNT_0010416215 /DNA_START=888 /DNA_END=1121 /DNA_ORIENTATION=+
MIRTLSGNGRQNEKQRSILGKGVLSVALKPVYADHPTIRPPYLLSPESGDDDSLQKHHVEHVQPPVKKDRQQRGDQF